MGPVMADRHFQHDFTQLPLTSTLYITADNNNNNNTTSPVTPPSSSPSSPSISSGHQGQRQHYHFHQHHSHHDHNPDQHSTHHHNQAQISALSTDQSSSPTPPIPVNNKKARGGYRGSSFPPDTYIAHAVAKHLLPDGPSMFGRRSDANCILHVGDVKYYVHVPILASRSPAFRRIFTDMIDNEAWGPNSDTTNNDYNTNSDISIHDEQHDDLDDGFGYDGHDLLSGEVGGEGGRGGNWSAHASTPTSLSTSTTATAISTGAGTSATPLSTTPTTSLTSTTMYAYSSMDEDQYDCYEDDDDEEDEEEDDDDDEEEDDDDDEEDRDETEQQQKTAVEGEEEELPELTLDFADPVGSRFDELLYWIYTDKGDRWLTHFTPQNYAAILQNIALLNLATPAALAICRAFEQSPANIEGVVPLGTADGYFMLP